MTEDVKPKASFLGGPKKAPPQPPPAEPVRHELPQGPILTSGEVASFLRGGGPEPEPEPEPQPEAPPEPTGPVVDPHKRAQAEMHLHKGLDHYDRQMLGQALEEYQNSVEIDPTFAVGFNNIGMVLIDLERYDDALEAIYESVRLDPGYSEAFNNLGFVLRRLQRNLEAVSAYARFLELEPDVEESAKIKGWMQTVLDENGMTAVPPLAIPQPGQQQPIPAPEEPKKVKKMAAWEVAAGNTATAAPVNHLGEIGEAAESAFSDIKDALAAAPPVAPAQAPKPAPKVPPKAPGKAAKSSQNAPSVGSVALIEKGLDHFAEGNMDEAAGIFQQAIDQDPNNPEALIGMGKVLVRQEKIPEGIEILERATQMAPDDPAGFYVYGFALRAAERNIEAAEAYEVFLRLMPDALDAAKMREWVTRIKGVAAVGDVEDVSVVDDQQIVTETDQKYKDALDKFQSGSVDAAFKDCVAILNEDAGHFRTRVLLGRVFLRQKDYDSALEQLNNSLVTRPDYPEAIYFLGQVWEKKGNQDKAIESYRRYLRVAPEGPRVERIQSWFVSRGMGDVLTGTRQVQCELCLRFFPEAEVTPHDNKATCRNCLGLMGAAPVESTLRDGTGMSETPSENIEIRRGGKGKKLLVAVLFLAAIGGAGFHFWPQIRPYAVKLGLLKDEPVKVPPKAVVVDKDVKGNGGNVPIKNEDPVKINIAEAVKTIVLTGEPIAKVSPFVPWSYQPKVEGTTELDKVAPGWTPEFSFQASPPGMTVGPQGLAWTPEPKDFTALKAGETYKVDLVIKGIDKGTDGARRELFERTKSFLLTAQFGFDLLEPQDLKLNPSELTAIASGDVNGDGRSDIVAATGQFRKGSVKLFLQSADGQLSIPAPLSATLTGARFSAAAMADLNGDGAIDVAVTNWMTGEVRTFVQDRTSQLQPGPKMSTGGGPVAIAVSDLNKDNLAEIAVLTSTGKTLQISSMQTDGALTAPRLVPVNDTSGRGMVFPWKSASGPGFVAVIPMAEQPILFVPLDPSSQPVVSGLTGAAGAAQPGFVAGAVPLNGPGGKQRLAVLLSAKTSRLVILEENNGAFTPVGQPFQVSAPEEGHKLGLGLIAQDFNEDGQDDLFVVMHKACAIYFLNNGGIGAGPLYPLPAKMAGPVVPFYPGRGQPPSLFMLDETYRAHVLKPKK